MINAAEFTQGCGEVIRRTDKLAHEKSYGLDRGGGFITACLKTKSQTWRNCPMAGVVGALILFHLKNYPFAGKKAFTIKDTCEVDRPARLATSGEEQKAENEPAIEVRPCTKPTDPKLTVSDVVHPPAVHRQHLSSVPCQSAAPRPRCVISVRTKPGATAFTVTPCGPSSMAKRRV